MPPPKWHSPWTTAFRAKGSARFFSSGWPPTRPSYGFRRFHATTLGDNVAMREVFRDSGFEIRSRSAAGTVDVQLSLTPSAEGVARRNGGGGRRLRRRFDRCSHRAPSPSSARRATWQDRRPDPAGADSRADSLGPVYPVHPSRRRRSGDCRRSAPRVSCQRTSTSPSSPSRRMPSCRGRRLRRGGRQIARRDHGRLRGDGRRGADAAGRARRERRAGTGCGWSAPTAWGC